MFTGATEKLIGGEISPNAGDEVLVADHHGNLIGKGTYNPHSLYRVRMIALATEDIFLLPLEEILQHRLQNAVDLRKKCLGMPSESTNAYRLVNSEGDRISGLVVDVYGKTAVAQSAALWVEKSKDIIIQAIKVKLGDDITVIWKQSTKFLELDGFKCSSNSSADIAINITGSDPTGGGIPIKESDLNYMVHPGRGQKTGFYCDQRRNRLMIRNLCKSEDLNIFS